MGNKPKAIYAFPSDINLGDSVDNPNWTCNGGMELRDYLAAKAMAAQLTAQWTKYYALNMETADKSPWLTFSDAEIAGNAYDAADAMMKARAL